MGTVISPKATKAFTAEQKEVIKLLGNQRLIKKTLTHHEKKMRQYKNRQIAYSNIREKGVRFKNN